MEYRPILTMKRYSHKDVLTANKYYYNQIGHQYCDNERYAYSEKIIANVKENLKKAASLLEERRYFLDFGCGSGFLSKLISETRLFEYGHGVDVSITQANLFNDNLDGSGHKAIIADIKYLPYADASFDMAGCYSVLHHLLDYKYAVSEVTRVLKPGGILYIDFEPTRKFRTLMHFPIKLRRMLIDRAPENLDQFEYLSEYHHNIEKGIHMEDFILWLKTDYDIISVKPRFPEHLLSHLLELFHKFSWTFAPYFYVVAIKRRR